MAFHTLILDITTIICEYIGRNCCDFLVYTEHINCEYLFRIYGTSHIGEVKDSQIRYLYAGNTIRDHKYTNCVGVSLTTDSVQGILHAFPSSLHRMTLEGAIGDHIPHCIQQIDVKTLHINGHVHLIKTEILPSQIEELYVRGTNLLGSLPSTLRKLWADYTPLSIDGNLTHFRACDRIPVEFYVLPSSLTHLTLGKNLRNRLKIGLLPPKLHTLIIKGGYAYNLIPLILPASLHILKIELYRSSYLSLPTSIHTLDIRCPPTCIKRLPASLRVLIYETEQRAQLRLPNSLKVFTYNGPFSNIIRFPRSLLAFTCSSEITCEQLKLLPKSLRYLKLNKFNYRLKRFCFPPYLSTLIIHDFNRQLKRDILPKYLEELDLGDEFDQEIGPGVLPLSLRTLKLGDRYNQDIDKRVLPPLLEHLSLGDRFSCALKVGVLPPLLKSLEIWKVAGYKLDKYVLPPFLAELIVRSDGMKIYGNVLPNNIIKVHVCNENCIRRPFPASLRHIHLIEEDCVSPAKFNDILATAGSDLDPDDDPAKQLEYQYDEDIKPFI